jgi:D-sedoheptulose 7-phosphate isomerase
MKFPRQRYDAAAAYFDAYASELAAALASVDRTAVTQAAEIIVETHRRDGTIWACGNGGSAAIANHLVCDHVKSVATDTGLRPRVHSLAANVELLTAIANDLSYADIFVHQLQLQSRPGDALITISSSGDSENVVRAAAWAHQQKLPVIAMTGFSGGRTAQLANVHLHVQAENYGTVEDAHQALMHTLAQYVRQAHMPDSLIPQRKF